MKDLEYCIKCDDPTGNAGEGDGSLYLDFKGPYCDACYFDVIHESHRQLKKENERYRKALEVIAHSGEGAFDGITTRRRAEEALQQSQEGEKK